VYRRFPDKNAMIQTFASTPSPSRSGASGPRRRNPMPVRRFAGSYATHSTKAPERYCRAIAGRIPITDQLLAARPDHDAALTELVTAAQQAGQLRHDIGSGDIWRYWCGDRSQCVRCRA
jgi:hypothetical protein